MRQVGLVRVGWSGGALRMENRTNHSLRITIFEVRGDLCLEVRRLSEGLPWA